MLWAAWPILPRLMPGTAVSSGYPQFEERDGRSLVIARTPVGHALLERSREAGVISADELPIREIDRMQPSQANRNG